MGFLDDITVDLQNHLDTAQADKSFSQDIPIVDIEEFLYGDDYLRIPFKISDRQLDFLKSMDDNFEDTTSSRFSEAQLVWGKGCFGKKSTTIHNTEGREFTIEELVNNMEAISSYGRDEHTGQVVKTNLSVPWCKGEEQLYEVELENGNKIEVTAGHKFYTKEGWKELRDLNEKDEILSWE